MRVVALALVARLVNTTVYAADVVQEATPAPVI